MLDLSKLLTYSYVDGNENAYWLGFFGHEFKDNDETRDNGKTRDKNKPRVQIYLQR